jgi:deoxyribonuclease V
MIACLDVAYRGGGAVAACVVFLAWPDRAAVNRYVARIPSVQPYEPGRFYRRELPCLLAVLAKVEEPLDVVVVDGHAWLGDGRPGLGAHLHEALARQVPVVGVAKSRFRGAPALPLRRGGSRQPLYVSAAGMEPEEAAGLVAAMAGPYRIPTLLAEVDRLCRRAR